MDEDVVVGFIVVMEIRKGIEWKYVDVCMTYHAMQCYAMLSRSLCVFVCMGMREMDKFGKHIQIRSHDTMRLVAASGGDIVS